MTYRKTFPILLRFFSFFLSVALFAPLATAKAKAKAHLSKKELQSLQKTPALCVKTLFSQLEKLHSLATWTLLDCLKKEKAWEKGLSVLEIIKIKNPGDAKVFENFGYFYEQLSKTQRPFHKKKSLDKAIDFYRKSLQKKENNHFIYSQLLKIFKEKNNYYESRVLLQKMKELYGETSKILNDFCYVYRSEKFIDDGIRYCKKAIKASPSKIDNHIYILHLFWIAGREKEALKKALEIKRDFKDSYFASGTLGFFYFKKNNWLLAEKNLRSALQLNPQSHSMNLLNAQVAFQLKKYKEALSFFKAACKINKKKTFPILRSAFANIEKEDKAKWNLPFHTESENCRARPKNKGVLVAEKKEELFFDSSFFGKKPSRKKSKKK